MKKDRGKVWLGACGIVENSRGEWLVVKKCYSGLKGRWSLPAGFVQEGETIDDAAVREIKEETGIDCIVQGLVGFRTGVIRGEISDNMAILYCTLVDDAQQIIVQEHEISEACWMTPAQLAVDEQANQMLKEVAQSQVEHHMLDNMDHIVPEEVFGYTKYNLFIKK
ncbi:NUDIX domain-containing protein [Lysinibacillus sp. LZ02]|uniref:NUDIX domain-containing protein n=1 Tax=Lysinibacillus sp. LZ02 TaxID=3420668 RepID=UPI003D35F790